MPEFRTEVSGEINDEYFESAVRVRYHYFYGCSGLREKGTGLLLTPDESPEIELIDALDENGNDLLPILSDREIDRLFEKAEQHQRELAYDWDT